MNITEIIPDSVFRFGRNLKNHKMLAAAKKANAAAQRDFLKQPEESGLYEGHRPNRIIVSFTTYPARIDSAYLVADCMLKQTVKPDKLVLYLAESQFPGKHLPDEYEPLRKRGLEIRWCGEDLLAHKKYFYAMQDFPDDIVVTVDDDVIYPHTLIENLYKSYKLQPNAVHATRGHRITIENQHILPYNQWEKDIVDNRPVAGYQYLATGVGGVLYPPHLLPKETFDTKNIRDLAIKADDLWLKVMEIKNGIPTVLTQESFPCYEIAGSQKTALVYDNVGRGLNSKILGELLKRYNLEEKLIKLIHN
ncbi:hypothetical protein KIH77_01690 [Bifidobacterium sp. 82T24]|uniref:hypothetical protein n=1 Tax=Bifidobacterium pluvialisilvae TaxID=2834436 RepID=UPI001C59BB73|nr:hypothetical protein [Bifidobacterium pluvialisilvae]MBW3087457.1 hypothetical protein [Bifidobacterium pluvialisilvae]